MNLNINYLILALLLAPIFIFVYLNNLNAINLSTNPPSTTRSVFFPINLLFIFILINRRFKQEVQHGLKTA
jgi:hypothetical protein